VENSREKNEYDDDDELHGKCRYGEAAAETLGGGACRRFGNEGGAEGIDAFDDEGQETEGGEDAVRVERREMRYIEKYTAENVVICQFKKRPGGSRVVSSLRRTMPDVIEQMAGNRHWDASRSYGAT
jgi:hypothetical protein